MIRVVSPPTVLGEAEIGSVLTASKGEWSGASTFRYQWERCPDPTTCTAIPGAVRESYTVSSADADSRLRIRVTGSSGSSSLSAVSSQTEAVPRHARFVASQTEGEAPVTITVDASGTSSPPGRPVAAYAWDFGDGESATGVTVQHTFSKPGSFTVTLTVSFDGGATDTASASMRVTGIAPVWPDHAELVVVGAGPTTASVSWPAAAAASGVEAYRVLLDGAVVAEVSASTLHAELAGLSVDTPYRVGVVAVGAEGIQSEPLQAELVIPTGLADAYRDAVLSDGPVGYWRFDDAQGDSVADSSGSGHGGSVEAGTLGFGVEGLYSAAGRPEDADSAAAFSSGHVRIGALGSASVFAGSQGTLEAWVRTDHAEAGARGILVKPGMYGLYLVDGVVSAYDATTSTWTSAGTSVADGRWHQVVLTYDSGVPNGSNLYVDGVLTATFTYTVGADTSVPLIGATDSGGEGQLSGTLDEVAYYDHILDTGTVMTHYALAPSQQVPQEVPLPEQGEPLTQTESDDHLGRVEDITGIDDVQTDPLTPEQEAELRTWATANGYTLPGGGQSERAPSNAQFTPEESYCALSPSPKVKVACAVVMTAMVTASGAADAFALVNDLPSLNGQLDGGAANAFKHCYWMGSATYALEKAPFIDGDEAADLAFGIGILHEQIDDNPVFSSTMDIHNNGFGVTYGADSTSEDTWGDRCANAALRGPLVKNLLDERGFPDESEPGRLLGRVGYAEKALNLMGFGARGAWAPFTVWKATAGTYGPVWDQAYEKPFARRPNEPDRRALYPHSLLFANGPLLACLEWDPDQSGVWRPTGQCQWTPTGLLRLVLNVATGTSTREGMVSHTTLFVQDTHGICAPTRIVWKDPWSHWAEQPPAQSVRSAPCSQLVSVTPDGGVPYNTNRAPAVSDSGRYVAFESNSLKLAPNDTSPDDDVFVRDVQTSETKPISVTPSGVMGDGASGNPDISADGRYIVFESSATNLDGAGAPGRDIFVADRITGDMRRVSVAADGTAADNASWDPRISGSGRYVAFTSAATNLVAGDTNGQQDVFVHDLLTGATTIVSVSSTGQRGDLASGADYWRDPTDLDISADGRHVAFVSAASNLVPGDTNSQYDVFVRDRWQGTTRRVSVRSDGAELGPACPGSCDGWYLSLSPALSANGRYVAFESYSPDLTGETDPFYVLTSGVFVYDTVTGDTHRMDVGVDGHLSTTGQDPDISADGRYVAFTSCDPVLAPPYEADETEPFPFCDFDVFVRDRLRDTTKRVTVPWNNTDPDNVLTREPAISADGRYVALTSRWMTRESDSSDSDVYLSQLW
ncbi:MAG: PKD domain-containing protein [Acidimicrobiia bacterium]|nr:PKD domain-containing protein [Acidimicrobiia bacterium]